MKNKSHLFLLLLLLLPSFANAQHLFTGKPQYQIRVYRADTLLGDILIELFPTIAPLATENFDSLVRIHFYDSTAFHRVIPGFMIQGGDPNSRSGPDSTWGYGDPDQVTVDPEFSSVSHLRGIISAARTPDPYSATSQFFICIGNPTYLDHNYTIFGHVISGMNVADLIVSSPRDSISNRPNVKISMFVTYTGSNDSALQAPAPLLPANGVHLPATTQTLRWSKVWSTMLYHLEVATDSAFTNVLMDSELNQIDTFMRLTKLKTGSTYYWRLSGNNGGSLSPVSPIWSFTVGTSAVSNSAQLTNSVQVYPNPSSGATRLRFYLEESASVSLSIRDVLGRESEGPLSGATMSAGWHSISLRTNELPAGIYEYILTRGLRQITGHFTLK